MFTVLLKKELQLIASGENRVLGTLVFFVLMLLFCEFTLSHNSQGLDSYSLISWVCIIFSAQASMYDLFERDYANGTLEQIIRATKIPELIIFHKTIIHWILTGVPLSIATVFVKVMLTQQISIKVVIIFFFIAMFGTLSLFFISAVGSALTMGKAGSSLIVSQIITLPVFFPTVIYIHYIEKNFSVYGTLNESNFLVGCTILTLIPIGNIISFISIKNAIECA